MLAHAKGWRLYQPWPRRARARPTRARLDHREQGRGSPATVMALLKATVSGRIPLARMRSKMRMAMSRPPAWRANMLTRRVYRWRSAVTYSRLLSSHSKTSSALSGCPSLPSHDSSLQGYALESICQDLGRHSAAYLFYIQLLLDLVYPVWASRMTVLFQGLNRFD